MEGLLIVLLFLVLLFLNVPIAYSLGISTLVVMSYFDVLNPTYLIQTMFTANDSFTLLAVPFFILAGDIMLEGGISSRLINFGKAMLGGVNGALGIITVFTCLIFAAISGSGPATVAAIGGIMIPAMIKDNYPPSFAASLSAASGALGPVIPPSILFVMYGVIAGVSISELFMAGVLPGIMIALILMAYTYMKSRRNNWGTKYEKTSLKEKLKAANEAKWALLVPVIILGGIYGGIFTPTEAAIVASDYALFVGIFVYKEINLKNAYTIFKKSTLTLGSAIIIVGLATAFGRVLTLQRVPQAIADGLLSITDNVIIILALINVFLLIVGMLMESVAAVVILAPLLLSIVVPLGVDPVHFGILLCFNLTIGMCTPPVGVNTFIAASIGGLKIEQTFKHLFPLIGVLIIALLLITYIPQISLILPSLLT